MVGEGAIVIMRGAVSRPAAILGVRYGFDYRRRLAVMIFNSVSGVLCHLNCSLHYRL